MKDSDGDKWVDFSVSQNGFYDGKTLYENFIKFKKSFDALTKKDLIDRGWIRDKNDIASLSNAFRDLNSGGLSTLYRRNDNAHNMKTFLWLSQVKSKAIRQYRSRGKKFFLELDKSALKKIVQMSVHEDSLLNLPSVLYEYGVILVYERSLPGMKVDGATFLLPNELPVVAVSFRYPRLDNFWFTLMHELSHVVLHRKMLSEPILDDLDTTSSSDIEIEANRLAKSAIVERHEWRNCEAKYSKDVEAIENFANEVGVHKSIIAGLLRNESGDYKAYSEIVNEINPRDIVYDD